jgi:hypothetical protein
MVTPNRITAVYTSTPWSSSRRLRALLSPCCSATTTQPITGSSRISSHSVGVLVQPRPPSGGGLGRALW